MQSHYEITVSKNGVHLFATAPRSAIDERKAKGLFVELDQRFPEAEGFKVTCVRWQASGEHVDFNVIG